MEPTIQQLAEDLASHDQVKVYRATQALTRITDKAGAPGNDEERKKVAAELVAIIEKTTAKKVDRGSPTEESLLKDSARRELLRQLGMVSGEADVAAIAKLFSSEDLREPARLALERDPSPAATKALIDAALNGIAPDFRVGAVNALAERSGAEVVDTLKKCAEAENQIEVRVAAAEALANQADPSGDAVIAAIGELPSARARKLAARARVRLADTLVRAGQKDAAKQIYQAVAASKAPEAQKKTAKAAAATL